MAGKTQCHGHMPLSGKRFSSFAGKTVTVAPTDTPSSAYFEGGEEAVARHYFPRSCSQFGRNLHHAFSFFPGLRPAGA